MKLSQIPSSALRLMGTFNMSRPILAINAASALTVKTTNPVIAVIDGIIRNVAALAAQVLTTLSTPFYVQPASTTVYYTLATDGTLVRVVQGSWLGQPLIINGINLVGDGTVPDVPDLSVASNTVAGVQILATQWCAFGIVKVVTNAGQTWSPGVDALDNATKATYTFLDVAFLPAQDRP